MNAHEKTLLSAYHTYFLQESIKTFQVGSILAIILVPMGSIFDYFIFPDKIAELFWIRIFCSFAVLCILVFPRYKNIYKKYPVVLAVCVAIIVCGAITCMVMVTGGYRSSYYAGINLVILFIGLLAPWRMREIIVATSIIYIMYVAPILIFQKIEDFGIFMNNNYFLLFTISIAITSNYFSARARYNEFVSKFNLDIANKELSKLDELKSQFFSNISHEIRTPLTSIIAPLENLNLVDIRNVSEEQWNDYLQQMNFNSKKLLKLINNLLDFTKLEAGKMQVNFVICDLRNILNDILSSVRTLAEQSNLSLEILLPEKEIELYLDPEKIDKVFLNLISNAIKFTPTEGKITILAKETDKSVFITIEDTGIGIPEYELPRLFERFHQVDGSSTRAFSGTGIGLHLVKELVDIHCGRITVESEENKGSKFIVELIKGKDHLPQDAIREGKYLGNQEIRNEKRSGDRRRVDRRHTDPKRLELADLETDKLSKQKLLETIKNEELGQEQTGTRSAVIQIVEDDAGIISSIRNILKNDYAVRIAFDGAEGWEAILNNPPDLVISDLMMPLMNGFELTEKIKKTEKTKHIPVIILTAKGELTYKIQGLEMGADDYIAKPFSQDELKARIRSLLNLRKMEAELMEINLELNTKNKELDTAYNSLKDAEMQLIHSEKLKSLGIMLMGLAHEMNNPLSISMGSIDILKSELKKSSQEVRKEIINKMLNSVEEGINRSFNVMDEIRKFAKKDKITFETCDLRENIESTLGLANHMISSGITIKKNFNAQRKIECIPGQINQVILNLLKNSIDAIRESGIITISTRDDGASLFLEVEDNGEGIKQEDLKQVLDPFFTTRDPNKGMGLGLSICYKIINDHNGRIDITSDFGKGTKVVVQLPLTQNAEKRA
ncbi:MAG: ATP-binding protein [bacterium]